MSRVFFPETCNRLYDWNKEPLFTIVAFFLLVVDKNRCCTSILLLSTCDFRYIVMIPMFHVHVHVLDALVWAGKQKHTVLHWKIELSVNYVLHYDAGESHKKNKNIWRSHFNIFWVEMLVLIVIQMCLIFFKFFFFFLSK